MSRISRPEVIKLLTKFKVWKRRGERAPHKPLLILLALGRVAQGCERLATFSELEPDLRRLLEQFGPPRKTIRPEYPFWWLQTDGLWEVRSDGEMTTRGSNSDPKKTELIKHNAQGGFPVGIYNAIRHDPSCSQDIARALLDANFPDSLHEEILQAVGLHISQGKAPRDSKFRHEVIKAYRHRCAICGYKVQIGSADLGLEAAHIKWHQAKGPDIVQNGFALCAIHHKALDYGAIGVTDEFRILISSEVHGEGFAEKMFYDLNGKELFRPHSPSLFPKSEFLSWHREWVFKGSACE